MGCELGGGRYLAVGVVEDVHVFVVLEGNGPVHQVKVYIFKPKALKGFLKRPFHILRLMPLIPTTPRQPHPPSRVRKYSQLRRNKNLLPPHPTLPNRLAHILLTPIKRRSINMSIPRPQRLERRLLDCPGFEGFGVRFVGAEAEGGDGEVDVGDVEDWVGFWGRHGGWLVGL